MSDCIRRGGRRTERIPLPEFLSLKPQFESFLVLKGLQPTTVDGHTEAMRRLTAGFNTTHPTNEEVDQFVVELYRSKASYSHKANNIRVLEYWLAFLGQPRHFNRQRKPRRLITQTLTEAEINRLFFMTKNINEKTVLALLAYSGLRPKELCNVRRCDLDLAARTLFISQGKGMKDALIELPSGCVELLMMYLAAVPRSQDDYLFTTYQGNQYTTGALRKMIKVLARRAGFTRRVWPYQMRHSFATNLLIRGAHLFYIKNQMRHAWVETTLTYLSSVPNLDSHERFFPKYF